MPFIATEKCPHQCAWKCRKKAFKMFYLMDVVQQKWEDSRRRSCHLQYSANRINDYKICYTISKSRFCIFIVIVLSVFVERMEDMDIFRLQTAFVIQGLVTCSWGVAVIKDIAHLVRITSLLRILNSPNCYKSFVHLELIYSQPLIWAISSTIPSLGVHKHLISQNCLW